MTKKIKRNIKRIIISAVLLIIAVLVFKLVNYWVGLALFIASYLIISYDVLKTAGINIIHGRVFDENFLMTLATIGAFACQEYEEAVFVMLFYQVGECFQSYAVNKSRKSIKSLMSIRPDFARIRVDGEEKEVDPSEVKVDDIIIIKPGERVPLDGLLIKGTSTVDTKAITGEALPAEVAPGSKIVSGCVNLTGVVEVKVTSEFAESTVSKILNLVEEASSKKAQAEKFITVFARYYTPIVVISALLLAIVGTLVTHDFRTWIYRAMTFLLISCPCALVISIPLSFFGGIGGASRVGILIKGGNYMDTLNKFDTLVLDKTGTITKGNFALASIEVTDETSLSKDKLLEVAAYAECNSTHPIAVSIVNKYGKEIDKSKVTDVTEIAGKGVRVTYEGAIIEVGNMKLMADVLSDEDLNKLEVCDYTKNAGTLVYVAVNGKYAGHMHIVDEIKSDSVEALKNIRKLGVKKIVMLTGDNEGTAKAVAETVGLDAYYANLSPLDKVSTIEKLMEENPDGKLAFVGDGINDAPVLSRADLGIAMGAMGSDAAIEAADVVLMTDELSKVYTAKKIARKSLLIVKENIIFALGVKVLILILAAVGIANMWAAIFGDVGVAMIAIVNAMRTLNEKQWQ